MTAPQRNADTADEARKVWREKRDARREKQRAENVVRAAQMHAARVACEQGNSPLTAPAARQLSRPSANGRLEAYVGCSGWFYWHWRGTFYPEGHPGSQWFDYYASRFRTVELNAPFYSWPSLATVATWRRQVGRRRFTYAIKVNELITHTRRFRRTDELVKDFGLIADLLGASFGCFLFQLPPSLHYSSVVLARIVRQLDPRRRNVVEFRHRSWWNERVYKALAEAGSDLLLDQWPEASGRARENCRRRLCSFPRDQALVST